MKYLLLFIIMASINYSLHTEGYSSFCTLSHFDHKKKFTPIQMIVNQVSPYIVQKTQKYVNINLPITALELKQLLSKIAITTIETPFKELQGFRYNLIDPPEYTQLTDTFINKISQSVFSIVSKHIKTYLSTKTKHCPSLKSCTLSLKDHRILKVGVNTNNNRAIEGQLLMEINGYHLEILVRYVASTINTVTLHYIQLDGFDFKPMFPVAPVHKNVQIYSNPLVNDYKADKTYLYSSNEKPILSTKIKRVKESPTHQYQCYGKPEVTQKLCEARYDSNGKPLQLVGVWDRPCKQNTNCPFYKKNTNYPNSFGGCIQNKCEMPIGAEYVSPSKFVTLDTILCGQCKTGLHCCAKQNNKKLYPTLKSPDYRFKNDSIIREKHNL
jgi:hypothetical protein